MGLVGHKLLWFNGLGLGNEVGMGLAICLVSDGYALKGSLILAVCGCCPIARSKQSERFNRLE